MRDDMADTSTDGASAPEAQTPALKSTDTSALNAIKAEAPKEPKPEAPAEPVQQDPKGDAGDEVDDAPSADATDGKKKDRLPRWVQERMERVRRVTEAETRERITRELLERQTPPRPTNVEPVEREKTLEDFDFDPDRYLKYQVQLGIEREKQREQRADAERKHAESVEQFKAKIDAFEEKVGAGAWEDIESSPLNTDPAFKPLVDLFLGDDNDLDIAHHLAMNPAEAKRLLGLSPLARVREVAKLAAQFDATPSEKPAPVPPKKVTNAPPPPKTVSGGGKATPSEDDEGITSEQRIALWQAKRRTAR